MEAKFYNTQNNQHLKERCLNVSNSEVMVMNIHKTLSGILNGIKWYSEVIIVYTAEMN